MSGSDEALLVDAGGGVLNIHQVKETLAQLPVRVVDTDAHPCHVGGNHEFETIAIHADDVWSLCPRGSGMQTPRRTGPLGQSMRGRSDCGRTSTSDSRATYPLRDCDILKVSGPCIEVVYSPRHSAGVSGFGKRRAAFSSRETPSTTG